MRLVHLGTEMCVTFGVLDESTGNIVQRVPVNGTIDVLDQEAFGVACEQLLTKRDELAAQIPADGEAAQPPESS